MPFVKRHRKYYKYGTELNATIVGSPTISNGVVSGFSTANYLTISKSKPNISSFEQTAKVTTGTDVTTQQAVFAGNPYKGLGTIQIVDKKIRLYASSDGTSNNIAGGVNSSLTVNASTSYWLKFSFTGSAYKVDLSTDGSYYTNYLNISSTLVPSFDGFIGIGTDTGNSNKNPFLGSIDLTQSYIKINGADWWHGTKAVESDKNDYDYHIDNNKLYQLAAVKRSYWKYGTEPKATVVGSPTISNGVVSGFSKSNYLVLPENFNVTGGKTWQMFYKIRTGSDVKSTQTVTGTNYYRYDPVAILVDGSKFELDICSGTGTTLFNKAGTYTVLPNTDYWIKMSFDGTKYTFDYSLDGVNYVNDISYSSTTSVYSQPLTIGIQCASNNGSFSSPWLGSVDLTQSYINIDNKLWWKGTKVVETTEEQAEWHTDRLVSYAPTIQDEFTYRITQTQRNTGTYTFTLDRDCVGNLLFVGNGGPGCSSAKDSRWHYSGGGSGACFQGRVRLPKGTYTLTIGTLGSAGFSANNHYNSGGVDSTDSYLTNSAGQELIRVGAGGKGYTSVGGYGGAGGVLKLGTLDVIETIKAVNGTTGGNTESTNFAKSAYDGTTSGYGAGTGSTQSKGTTYGVAGIFDLRIEYLDKGLRSY